MPMTRRSKLILLLIAAPIVLILVVVIAALTPAVQTFAARRALAGQGDVARVSVGTGGAEITGLTITQPGVKISVPSLRADVPVIAAARGKIAVGALVVRDIEIDYDPVAAAAAAKDAPAEPDAPAKPFDGLLKALELPAGLEVNGLDLAGVVRVAGPQPVTLNFTLTGGGLAAGREGRFDLKLTAKADRLGDVATTIALLPQLDAAGQLSALVLRLDATGKGGFLAKPASLRTEATITRDGAGEAWSMRLIAAEKSLFELDTKWAPGAASLPGRWKIDLTDADLAAFVAPFALPTLVVTGAGDLAVAGTDSAKLSGGLKVLVDSLESLGLPALGPISLVTNFDVEGSAAEARVNAFKLDLASGAAPALAVEAKQAFAYALATGKLAPARPADELLAVNLLGVPSAWIALFVPELALGGPVTGAWSVRPEGDGVAVDSTAPFQLTALRYGPKDAPLVAFDTVQLDGLRVRQNSSGLEAALGQLRITAAGAELLTAKLTATQKPAAPLLARIELKAQLAPLAAQPALIGQTVLTAGQAVLSLDISAGDAQNASGQLRVSGLRAPDATLPDVTLDLAVERSAAGVIVARLPFTFSGGGAKQISDLELSATASPGAGATWNVVAKLVSQVLSVPDLQAFAALLPPAPVTPATPVAKPETAPSPTPAPAPAPLWAGVTGELELSLARIVLAPGIEVTNTAGRVALTEEALSLDNVRTLLGTGGSLAVNGGLRWLAASQTYALAADVKGADVAVGPLLRALNPKAAAPVEGTYALQASLKGEGADPALAAQTAEAAVQLTGRAGVLRALNLDTNALTRIGGSKELGLAVGLLGALSGNPEIERRAQQVAAANGFARKLSNLPYDEIVVQAGRNAAGEIEVKELRLSSPEIRLAGSGGILNQPGVTLMNQPLRMSLDFGASGELATQLAALRLLKDSPVRGYAPLVEPLVLDGTMNKIGMRQLNRLVQRALGL